MPLPLSVTLAASLAAAASSRCCAAIASAESTAEAASPPVAAPRFGDARIAAWTREAIIYAGVSADPAPDEALLLWRRLAAVPAQRDEAHALARFCGVLAQSITDEGPPRLVSSGESWAVAISFAALRRHAATEEPWRACLAGLCARLASVPHGAGGDLRRRSDRTEALWQA